MARVDCAHFNGYKPCGRNSICDETCSHYQERGPRILLIHLGALGAVVRSTALLVLIHEKYPAAEITWVTENPAQNLLKNHPRIKRVLTTSAQDLLCLEVLEFDHALCLDKSITAGAILNKAKVKGEKLGFYANSNGVILPLNAEANELWELGLNDQKKFFENKKTEISLLQQTLRLPDIQSDYDLPLTAKERELVRSRREQWTDPNRQRIVGINTGCAATLPHKKLSVQNHRDLISLLLQEHEDIQIVLLGGPEDEERNLLIAENKDVLCSPTQLGLRDGLCSVAACDVVLTGDSLGLHMAISQKVPVVVWFGPSCHQEIELYGRGEKILTKAKCSPCWKRTCNESLMCYDQVDLNEMNEALHRQLSKIKNHENENQLSRTDSVLG